MGGECTYNLLSQATEGVMGKWLAGIAASVISAVLIWLITKPPMVPPAPPPAYSVNGVWKYTRTSNVSHKQYQGTLRLLSDANNKVEGDFLQKEFDNSNRSVHGSFDGRTLEL